MVEASEENKLQQKADQENSFVTDSEQDGDNDSIHEDAPEVPKFRPTEDGGALRMVRKTTLTHD